MLANLKLQNCNYLLNCLGGGMQNSNDIDKFDFNESFIFYSEELGFYQFF